MSIRRTLLTCLLAGLTLVLTGAGAAVFFRTRTVLTREFDAALRLKASILAAETDYDEDGKVELDLTGLVMPEYERDEYYQIRLPDGQTIARSPSLGFADLPAQAGTIILPNGHAARAVVLRHLPTPAEDEQPVNPNVPEVTLVVARDRAVLDRTLAGIWGGLLLVGAVVLAATTLLVTLAVRRGLAPLDAIARQTATIKANSLETRFATAALPAELRPIAERLNDLFARLDDAFQRERRVTAAIAHELRTPIAELHTLAEVGLKWPAEASFADALQIAQRMETMVTGLLALARHEAGQQPLMRTPVVLQKLVEEIWQPLARPLDVKFAVTGTWQTDPTLLRLIVTNLLTNAVEYTAGTIRVTGDDSHLAVVNSVTGLTADDLPHLFERFWRKDLARTDGGHTGLGLTLALAAATALGLKLTAEMPDPTTLRLTLRGDA